MRCLEKADSAAAAARALSKSAAELPSNAVKARVDANLKSVQRLLGETERLADPVDALRKLQPLVAAWARSGKPGDLAQPRFLRQLCYFIDDSGLREPSLLRSGKALGLFTLMDASWRDSYLSPLVLAYLRVYADDEVPGNAMEALVSLLVRRLREYSGKRPVAFMAKLLDKELFLKRSPESVAKLVGDQGVEWFAACEAAGIDAKAQGTAFFGVALAEFARTTKEPGRLVEERSFERIKALSDADIPKAALALLIPRLAKDESNIQRLVSLSFAAIGDPMTESAWRCGGAAFLRYNKDLEAARIAVATWINRQVVEYFFSKAEMDEGRKDFWLAYAPKMEMIRIAMHTGWSYSFHFSSNKDLDNWIQTRLVRVQAETSDIGLIMEYGDWAIVEIGTHGNACYFYRRDNTIIKRLQTKIPDLPSLKKTFLPSLRDFNYEGEGRVIHSAGWQYTLKNILRNKLRLTA